MRALLLALAAAAVAAHPGEVGAFPASTGEPDAVSTCVVSTGRTAVAALSNDACSLVLLDGVVSVHDADFPRAPVVRTANVTIRPADPLAPGVVSALPRAALEASPLLRRTVTLARGVTATLQDVSVAGAAAGGAPDAAIFSIFKVEHGAALVEIRCDLRARAWMCPSHAAAAGVAVDMDALRATAVGGAIASRPADAHGDVAGVSGDVDASRFYRGPPAAPLPDGTPPPLVRMVNATLFCAGVPGDGGERRDARVLTSDELAAALGATGSRTLLLTGSLALPDAGPDAPGALVQNRAVVLRSTATDAAGGGGRVTLSVPASARCTQPAVATGPGSSVALSEVDMVADTPGCALSPAVRCPLPGGAPGSVFTPRGSLLPAGGAGVYSGGRLLLDGVDIAYVRCTREFEAVAAALARAAGPDGAKVTRDSNGGLTLACTACAIDGCFLPDAPSARGTASLLFRNTTLRCGGAAAARAAAALAAADHGGGSRATPRAPPSAGLVVTATLAVAGVAVLAGAVGAALGTRRARGRVADAAAAADSSATPLRWSLFGRGSKRKVADDSVTGVEDSVTAADDAAEAVAVAGAAAGDDRV